MSVRCTKAISEATNTAKPALIRFHRLLDDKFCVVTIATKCFDIVIDPESQGTRNAVEHTMLQKCVILAPRHADDARRANIVTLMLRHLADLVLMGPPWRESGRRFYRRTMINVISSQ